MGTVYICDIGLACTGRFLMLGWTLKDVLVHHGPWLSGVALILVYDAYCDIYVVPSADVETRRPRLKTMHTFRYFLAASVLTSINEGCQVFLASTVSFKERQPTQEMIRQATESTVSRFFQFCVLIIHFAADIYSYFNFIRALATSSTIELFEMLVYQYALVAASFHLDYIKSNLKFWKRFWKRIEGRPSKETSE